MDKVSRGKSLALTEEERLLFNELTELSKNAPDFDEDKMKEKLQILLDRRHELLESLDQQIKSIQKVYDVVDGRITFMDSCTKDLEHLLVNNGAERTANNRKKRKRKSTDIDNLQALEEQPNEVTVDPNEPVYCYCRGVSYGTMIGCENDDCRYQWFHYQCVGLSEEPKGIWFCPDCSSSKQHSSDV